jgi:hypothetical protein
MVEYETRQQRSSFLHASSEDSGHRGGRFKSIRNHLSGKRAFPISCQLLGSKGHCVADEKLIKKCAKAIHTLFDARYSTLIETLDIFERKADPGWTVKQFSDPGLPGARPPVVIKSNETLTSWRLQLLDSLLERAMKNDILYPSLAGNSKEVVGEDQEDDLLQQPEVLQHDRSPGELTLADPISFLDGHSVDHVRVSPPEILEGFQEEPTKASAAVMGSRRIAKIRRPVSVNDYLPESDLPAQSQETHDTSFTSNGSTLEDQPSIFSPPGSSNPGTSANTSFRSTRKPSEPFPEWVEDMEDWLRGTTRLHDDKGQSRLASNLCFLTPAWRVG